MNPGSPAGRLGMWSAAILFGLGLVYVATGALWLLLEEDAQRRQALAPVDPYLAVLEVIIVLLAPLMIALMAAVHASAGEEHKAHSLTALVFMSLAAGTTCGIHFVQLVVLRRVDPGQLVPLAPLAPHPWRWPSAIFALDLLAWDLFVGLSLLLAAPLFRVGRLQRAIRSAMLLGGVLCVAGLLGPATGDLRFQTMAIVGYAGVFPIVCLLLAILFGRAGGAPVTPRAS